MNMNYTHHMDAQDAEDAAFYAELTRQILDLMDEDDETYANRTPERRVVSGGKVTSGNYFGWLEGGRSLEVPNWMENLWSNSGTGTGVFIPRVVAAAKPGKRRHRRSRKNSNGGRLHPLTGQKIQA